MGKQVKETRGGNNNPKGKGGLGERKHHIKPGPGRGHKKKIAPGVDVLADLTKAYTEAPDIKDSAGVKAARDLIKSDYAKFLALWAKARGEVFQETAEAPVAAVAKAEVGEKESKVLELIERLGKAWEDDDETPGAER